MHQTEVFSSVSAHCLYCLLSGCCFVKFNVINFTFARKCTLLENVLSRILGPENPYPGNSCG